jgi:GntR family transcriptional repressor for pyruvate dehydrogenase complex
VVDRSDSGQDLLRDMSATERHAEEVIDFRTVFEPEIAALAAGRRTESDLVMLGRLCDYEPDQVGASESLDLDQRFHEAVAAATHNQLIVTLGRVTSEWLVEFRRVSHASVEGRRMSLYGHREIAEAIGAGDVANAAAAMRAHVTAVGRM